jgi:hypothetical protein
MLSSLWGGIKSVVSSVGKTANKILSGGKTASAGMSFPMLPGTTLQNGKVVQNQTPLPNQSTPYGPGVAYEGGTAVLNNKGQVTGVVTNTSGKIQHSPIPESLRPSTYTGQTEGATQQAWTPTVDQYGRISSKQAGNPYFDAGGNLVTPKTAFGGLLGEGGSGYQSTPTVSPTGEQGRTGVGSFGQNFGSGMGTNSTIYGQPSSDEQKRKTEGGTQTITPADKANQMAGDAWAGMAEGAPAGPEVPEIKAEIDAGWVQQMTKAVGQMEGYGGADRQQIMADIGMKLQTAYQNLTIQAQERPPMVEDSPERQAFLESLQNPEERNAMTQALDAYEAQNTNLIRDEGRLDLLKKQVRATDEIFTAQVNEIKDNPNLPKALARKKVVDLLSVNERAMKNVMTNIGDLEMSINNQRRQVDMAFNIYRETKDDYRYQQKLVQDQVDRYLGRPELFTAMNDSDLQAFSQASGISVKNLKKMGEDAIKPNVKTETIGSATTGYYNVIKDEKTGKVISSTLIRAGVPEGGTGGGGETFKSGGMSISGSDVAAGERKLLASRGQDGFVDPTVYLNMYNTWTSRGGLVSDFTKQYPPDTYVNPANSWLPKELMPKSKISF